MRIVLVLLILFTSFALSLELDYSCPEEVVVSEGFSCSIKILDGEGSYDVKFEVKEDDKTISRVWDEEGNSWKSGFYYLNSRLESGETEEILFMIEKVGEFSPILKIRQGSKIESFNLDITVEENEEPKENEELETTESSEKVSDEEKTKTSSIKKEEISVKEEVQIEATPRIISLNEYSAEIQEEVLVESKFSKELILKALGIFVILIIGFVLWEKV